MQTIYYKKQRKDTKFEKAEDSRYIDCNQRDQAFLVVVLRIYLGASDKVLRYKAFNMAKNLKCDGYQRGLTLTVYKSFDKKASAMRTQFKDLSYMK